MYQDLSSLFSSGVPAHPPRALPPPKAQPVLSSPAYPPPQFFSPFLILSSPLRFRFSSLPLSCPLPASVHPTARTHTSGQGSELPRGGRCGPLPRFEAPDAADRTSSHGVEMSETCSFAFRGTYPFRLYLRGAGANGFRRFRSLIGTRRGLGAGSRGAGTWSGRTKRC
ncbi:hypothetical protein FA13DRAFT_473160 [Coprinellus micaceus]|uniref:Uncharacterized protein n=1 Tax=Coprinellus micaceus TaxID=71717 RepID=A0A4Y7TA21_COPMI|nr:hypothetical protein FA13DRAFT_473160 [Coprinellus micaceus]